MCWMAQSNLAPQLFFLELLKKSVLREADVSSILLETRLYMLENSFALFPFTYFELLYAAKC